MKLRKISATVLISAFAGLLLAAALGPLSAQADEKRPKPRPSDGISFSTDSHHEDHDEDHDDEDEDDEDERSEHEKLRERYGEDGIEQVFLPPLVVTDPANAFGPAGQKPLPGFVPGPNGEGALTDATNIDPKGSAPIDVKHIKANHRTPAETFFEAATVGLVAMGAGSASLGAIAIRRAVKVRKTSNADYIYE